MVMIFQIPILFSPLIVLSPIYDSKYFISHSIVSNFVDLLIIEMNYFSGNATYSHCHGKFAHGSIGQS
jgi:hypothetical protein